MGKSYFTIAQHAQIEINEKKSRFLAFAYCVEEEEQVSDILEEIRAKYRDATHVVYAYQMGKNCEFQRSNDDGEPAGTAGRPVLEAMKKENLQDVLVIVVRYFGGILLGAGGLTRAYGKAAKMAIDAAGIVHKIPACAMSLTMAYPLWGKVEAYLQQHQITCLNSSFTDQVSVICAVAESALATMQNDLQQIGNGQIHWLNLQEEHYISQKVE